MKAAWFSSFSSYLFRFVPIFVPSVLIAITTGCGSSAGPTEPKLSGNTSVTVLLSSTANDQLQRFEIGLQSITLTSQSGKNVTLFTLPQGSESWAEFIHLNGGIEPFVTVDVPQDIYTAATATVDQSFFVCVGLTPTGGLLTAFYGYGSTPDNAPETNVTVNLTSPITITGNSMGLVFDLQVAQSATYPSCYAEGTAEYSITPTFNLTPLEIAASPANSANGKISQLGGQVTAIDSAGSGFTLALPSDSRTVSIGITPGTVYQGVNSFSALSVGTFLDLDGALKSDGSISAMRIAVLDSSARDVQVGPAMVIWGDPLTGEGSGFFFSRASQGEDRIGLTWPYNIHAAVFQISGQMANLTNLPFVPSFNASNLVAGQNVYVSTNLFRSPDDPYTPASTVTLMPQTINGTVVASQQSGNFVNYTVSLADYDLFPALAVQDGQTTLLNNPGQVEVYVDSNTQKLNTQALVPGSTLRFYGLVFNDNGTLRMDCAQVNDGVTASAQSSSGLQVKGRTQEVRRAAHGIMQQTTTTTK